MKIRNGFVSNSSSSSFLIYGINISDQILKSDQKFLEYLKSNTEELLDNSDQLDDMYIGDLIYEYIDATGNSNIKVEIPYDGESGYYIGCQWSSVRDDQTGLQFKNRIKREIKQLLPTIKDEEFHTFSESWYS